MRKKTLKDFRAAGIEEFQEIRDFYWDLIDTMQEQQDCIGWKKGIYPTEEYIKDSLLKKELYTMRDGGKLCACVILNSASNPGYQDARWKGDYLSEEVLVLHALAVCPTLQGQGVGRELVNKILATAKEKKKKAIRLDILGTNAAAERLYTQAGFQFVETKKMFYEDTGWTDYKLFQLIL